jgi:hypothetical protein
MTTTLCEPIDLTALDRCDCCPAAARVIATFMSGQLMFCGHHAKANLTIKQKAISVYDPDNFLI